MGKFCHQILHLRLNTILYFEDQIQRAYLYIITLYEVRLDDYIYNVLRSRMAQMKCIYEIKDENAGYTKVYAISPEKLSVIVDSSDELFCNRVYFRQFTDKTIFNGGKFKAFVSFIYSSIRSS